MEEDVQSLLARGQWDTNLIPEELVGCRQNPFLHVGKVGVSPRLLISPVEENVAVVPIQPEQGVAEVADVHTRPIDLIHGAQHDPDPQNGGGDGRGRRRTPAPACGLEFVQGHGKGVVGRRDKAIDATAGSRQPVVSLTCSPLWDESYRTTGR
jgi:hypothetical protein